MTSSNCVLQKFTQVHILASLIFIQFSRNFSQLFLPPDSPKSIFQNIEINFEIQILFLFFFTGPLAIWPISPQLAHWACTPIPLSSSRYRAMSAAALLPRHGVDPVADPLFNRVTPPPLPSLTWPHFLPLLHSGNGTIYHCHPLFPAASASV
jgi:hypothetical protein